MFDFRAFLPSFLCHLLNFPKKISNKLRHYESNSEVASEELEEVLQKAKQEKKVLGKRRDK